MSEITGIQKNNKNEKAINNEEILNEYNIDRTLDKGNFGKVKLGIHRITKEKVS